MSSLTTMSKTNELLASMSDDCLLGEIRNAVVRLANDYVALAVYVREANRRDLDIDAIAVPANRLFKRLVQGSLHEEAYVKFGDTAAINTIAMMPLDKQERLAEIGAVDVYDPKSDSHIKLPITSLDQAQTRMVFADASVRSVDMQRRWFNSNRISKSITDSPPSELDFTYDAKTDSVKYLNSKTAVPVRGIVDFLQTKLGYKVKKAMTD